MNEATHMTKTGSELKEGDLMILRDGKIRRVKWVTKGMDYVYVECDDGSTHHINYSQGITVKR